MVPLRQDNAGDAKEFLQSEEEVLKFVHQFLEGYEKTLEFKINGIFEQQMVFIPELTQFVFMSKDIRIATRSTLRKHNLIEIVSRDRKFFIRAIKIKGLE